MGYLYNCSKQEIISEEANKNVLEYRHAGNQPLPAPAELVWAREGRAWSQGSSAEWGSVGRSFT